MGEATLATGAAKRIGIGKGKGDDDGKGKGKGEFPPSRPPAVRADSNDWWSMPGLPGFSVEKELVAEHSDESADDDLDLDVLDC
eukprot:SAG11_NODE_5067_length_1674_cov_1.828571_3_plen_84_part_00